MYDFFFYSLHSSFDLLFYVVKIQSNSWPYCSQTIWEAKKFPTILQKTFSLLDLMLRAKALLFSGRCVVNDNADMKGLAIHQWHGIFNQLRCLKNNFSTEMICFCKQIFGRMSALPHFCYAIHIKRFTRSKALLSTRTLLFHHIKYIPMDFVDLNKWQHFGRQEWGKHKDIIFLWRIFFFFFLFAKLTKQYQISHNYHRIV